MTENEFLRQQQAAVERMREMNARSSYYTGAGHKMPPAPSFVRIPEREPTPHNTEPDRVAKENAHITPPHIEKNAQITESARKKALPNEFQSTRQGFNIPFLDMLSTDSDATLIIGLLLILMSENSDKMLLFALIYILM